jgi:CBS domain-containing membrane protein
VQSDFEWNAITMNQNPPKDKQSLAGLEIGDDDLYEAMKEIPGYLDITPGDLKEVYSHAYRHALDRITNSVRARDLMTGAVYTVQRDTPLRDVAGILDANEISGVPVIDTDMRVIGIISEKDFCSHMGDRASKSLMGVIADCIKNQSCFAMTIREKKAEDIMTAPVVTVGEDATLRQITTVLAESSINRVPVVDSRGCLVGIISRADIIRVSF